MNNFEQHAQTGLSFSAHLHSFVPHTVHAWKLLPESVVNLPLQHFKSNIVNYITPAFNNALSILHCMHEVDKLSQLSTILPQFVNCEYQV